MMKIRAISSGIIYSFPVQLVLTHLKRNQLMILAWLVLTAMVTGNFGKYLGVPYLFLDPEYRDKVGIVSFFIVGVATAGFAAAFNITTYITEGHRFGFVGALPRPFTKFALNNSIIPIVFIGIYVFQLLAFHVNNYPGDSYALVIKLVGFFAGLFSFTALLYTYFYFTQKDIFRYVVCKLDEKLKHSVPMARSSAMKKLDIARKKQERVDFYLDYNFQVKRVGHERDFYDRQTIIQVFDQNHFNLVVIELSLFALIIFLGLFKDVPAFQLPAAASFMLFLTAFMMIAGAFGYWFGGWSGTAALLLFLGVNFLYGKDVFSKTYEAFGLDYTRSPVVYNSQKIQEVHSAAFVREDSAQTMVQLTNWRSKFDSFRKPKLVLIGVSGGGKRSALWALSALQTADSLTQGGLSDHAVLITGASGGLIGASYFRELKYREQQGEASKPWSAKHRENISSDNLNPLIFSLLANDLFVGLTKFEYSGKVHNRDRAFTFEEQLNLITDSVMDRPLKEFKAMELSGKVPMILLSPTIINDGRKLYIASRPVSYMNTETSALNGYGRIKTGGVDYHRLFDGFKPENLRFLSALRMSATFPYITPNTTLPTQPPLLIMDAGISDNFGLGDAVRFLYAFRTWIAEHTSGVIFLSVRDSPKIRETPSFRGRTLVDELTQPISSVYNNFENFQDINSDLMIAHATSWFKAPIHRIDIQYQATEYVPILKKIDSIRQNSARASLSWRLTEREKKGIVSNLNTESNRQEFARLRQLLEE
ncbi:MAG: patatin-like phospholipase family protein [Cyclobacteriaceae bacterium]